MSAGSAIALAKKIHAALRARTEANFHLGCSEEIELVLSREELQHHLKKRKLYQTTMSLVTTTLENYGYAIEYEHQGPHLKVRAFPKQLLLQFHSLKDLQTSPWLTE